MFLVLYAAIFKTSSKALGTFVDVKLFILLNIKSWDPLLLNGPYVATIVSNFG